VSLFELFGLLTAAVFNMFQSFGTGRLAKELQKLGTSGAYLVSATRQQFCLVGHACQY
jgi:hypothetical protein